MNSPPRVGVIVGALRLIYEIVAILAAAVCVSVAAIGRIVGSGRLRRLGERAGEYDTAALSTDGGPVVWLHAASVGEVRAAEPLLAALRARVRGVRFVLTCQTAAGLALSASAAVEERRFLPIDCRFAVRRALAHFRPSLFVCVEVEIWPRLLLELSSAGVPAAMVGARVSERSFRRYRRVRGLFASALATVARICARDDVALRRLVELGAPSARGRVCGDLKLDALDAGAVVATCDALRGREDGTRILFAVSTHEGEEAIVLDAFSRVRNEHPSARLVLAPRHPRRADAVCALAAAHGRVARWSRDHSARGWDVLVIDTTGEARGFFPAADCVFVGGSLTDVGGHNLAEPAAFGVPCAVGPRLENVRHQAELFGGAGALVVVDDAQSLGRVWSAWLRDPIEARRVGAAGRAVVEANRGAIARTLVALEPVLASLETGAAA